MRTTTKISKIDMQKQKRRLHHLPLLFKTGKHSSKKYIIYRKRKHRKNETI